MTNSALCPFYSIHSSLKLYSLEFTEKQYLPQRTDVNLCTTCNFAFSSPRDAEACETFYSNNLNDNLSADHKISESEVRRYDGQIEDLQQVLQQDRALRILDMGCGQAGLLRMMKNSYSDNIYYGVDPNVVAFQKSGSGIRFPQTWKDLDQKFDLIILSHMVEHIVDFSDFRVLPELLADRGHVYIEDPDASRYLSYARQEHLYFFDRLHINHFTHDPLSALAMLWGLVVSARYGSEFEENKDGRQYPAIFFLATLRGTEAAQAEHATPLAQTLDACLQNEAERSHLQRDALRKAGPIVVYGVGDNFSKSVGPQGSLSRVKISAVID
jgi:SAM-dependent methyltransferase